LRILLDSRSGGCRSFGIVIHDKVLREILSLYIL
jgi:hypothetical protein